MLYSQFLAEYSDLISSAVLSYDHILLAGNFSVHVDKPDSHFTLEFLSICESFNLRQQASSPTHECGHTLDLVFTLGLNITSILLRDFISDH